jgi:neutral amino acid transport system ATP-binding protein
MEISDWVVVLGEGRVIAEGPPQTVATNPAVIDAYLGTDHAARHAPVPIEEAREAAEALDVSTAEREESAGRVAQ